MKAEMNFDNIGGGNVSLKADLTDELYNITTQGASWVATQDCVLIGAFAKASGQNAYACIQFDDVNMLMSGSTYDLTSVYSAIGTGDIGLFIPKGTKVSTIASYGQYNLHFYSVA